LALVLLPVHASGHVSDLIAGIGIAQNDHVYVWHKDGMVTVGNVHEFEKYSHARPYTLPQGRHVNDIIAVSIAGSNDHCYVWYRDGSASSGTSTDLGQYRAPYPYTLPPGKQIENIVGIGIAKNDRVYTWYDDLTFTIGTSSDLDRYQAPQAYQLPNGMLPSSVVEFDIAKSIDRVHVWYIDGTGSSGTFQNPGNHDPSYGYVPAQMIYRWWGPVAADVAPGTNLPSLVEDASVSVRLRQFEDDADLSISRRPKIGFKPGSNDDFGDMGPALSPAFSTPIYPSGGSIDPMLAVGDQYVITSDTGSLAFYDKQGNPLPTKNGIPGHLSSSTFFNGFTADKNPDGSLNQRSINRYLGYPKPCDSPDYPQTDSGRRFCIVTIYDTRVLFDPTSKRFFVIANSRAPLWAGEKYKTDPDYMTCGVYTNSNGVNVGSNDYCDLARRYVFFAVSRTEDPRDGFYQYALTENNYRDWPWMGVNGDAFVVGSHGAESTVGPVATVISVKAIKDGKQHPPYFRYYTKDVNGITRVMPPSHYEPNVGVGLTFLLGNDGDQLKIFGFPPTADPWTAPKLLTASINISDGVPSLAGVYRKNKLYLAGTLKVETAGDLTRYSVRVIRIPLAKMGQSLVASKDTSKGYLDRYFGRNAVDDAPGDRLSYEKIAIAVNKNGDMILGFRRNPFQSANPLFPEARYSVWYANETKQRRSNLLRKGDAPSTEKIDYTTAVVDPTDDRTFWVALPYAGSGGTYKTVVAKIVP
jgi:hypothetical protein